MLGVKDESGAVITLGQVCKAAGSAERTTKQRCAEFKNALLLCSRPLPWAAKVKSGNLVKEFG